MKILEATAAAINCILHEGLTRAMNRYNRDILAEPPDKKSVQKSPLARPDSKSTKGL